MTFDLKVVAELAYSVLSVVVVGTDVCRDLDVESLVCHCVPLAVAVDNKAVAPADVVADKVVGVCVVESVALDSHTYGYKNEHL